MATPDASDTNIWLERAAGGDAEGWRQLLARHHDRLRRMVAVRLDPRLYGRVDPSDVLQEAYLDAAVQLPAYVKTPNIPFFLWLRLLAGSRLSKVHLRHLGRQRRDAAREVSLDRPAMPAASSAALAARLLGRGSRPSEAAVRAELKARLVEALDELEPLDRDVLALRHFEQLSTAESAAVLGVSESAAAKRYLRAIMRLRVMLRDRPGGLEDFLP
jgi:RNA polymerase sigma-70 factor (ECF subfamily)